jgi:hypothetical protein
MEYAVTEKLHPITGLKVLCSISRGGIQPGTNLCTPLIHERGQLLGGKEKICKMQSIKHLQTD